MSDIRVGMSWLGAVASTLMAIATSMLLLGCGTSTSATARRLSETGTVSHEHVVVLLRRYTRNNVEVQEPGSVEESLGTCIRRRNASQTFLAPQEFRKFISGATTANDISPEALLASLDKPDIAARLDARVRLVILLEVLHWSRSDWFWCTSGFCTGRKWTDGWSIAGTVVDMKHRRVAGSIEASSTGNGMAGIFIIFPVFFWPDPESHACAALGEQLARLASGEI